jgi:predicted secreted protein
MEAFMGIKLASRAVVGLGLAFSLCLPAVAAGPQASAPGHPHPGPFQPQPANVLSLTASGSVEVVKDWLSLTLATSRSGADAQAVQAALRAALDAALTEARKAAAPGLLEVRTGQFGLYTRHDAQGRINGWQGSAELVLEGRDWPRITQTAGRVNTLAVSNTSQSLSREAREQHESHATALAVARFQARAQEQAKLFGFAGYSLREVNVSTNEPGDFPQPVMMRSAAMAAESAMPVEAGRQRVTVTVSGSVQMK